MDRRSIQEDIWVGTAVRFLIDIEPGVSIHSEGGVLANIRGLHRYLRRRRLLVTSATRANQRLTKLADTLRSKDLDDVLSEDEARELSQCVQELRQTLDAETSTVVTYSLRPKRYDIDRLVNNVGELLPSGVFAALPEQAQADLVEAGRCVAFELSTAAAFHLMRATESVLRDYYRDWVRTRRLSDPLLWHPMVKDMRSRRTRPTDALLDSLDHIRKNFRNPTQHPDAVYDIEQAQDLFGLVCDVVSRMSRERRD